MEYPNAAYWDQNMYYLYEQYFNPFIFHSPAFFPFSQNLDSQSFHFGNPTFSTTDIAHPPKVPHPHIQPFDKEKNDPSVSFILKPKKPAPKKN